MQTGFIGTTLGGKTSPPPSQLDITVLYAKTQPDPFGILIPPQTWQQDHDPIFYWQPPPSTQLAGYSHALNQPPDNTVDTTGTFWNVAQDPMRILLDGQHTFSVKAIATSGTAGNPISFAIWVDATAPTVSHYSPTTGSLVNTLSPPISITLSDPHSGVNPVTIVLTINGTAVPVAFDPATGVVTASAAGVMTEGTNTLMFTVSDQAGNAMIPLVWTITADVTPPSGTVLINGGALETTSVYVTLNLTATDAVSGVVWMHLSNDPLIGYVQEPFTTVRKLWRLNAVKGPQSVYVKFEDAAGNVSDPVTDDIMLDLLAPDTIILTGPAGLTPQQDATFTFTCPEGTCVFSYAFDNEAWSSWDAATTATKTGLALGNHYFRVKAAKEVNGTAGIQLEEEDPTPAERTWIVGVEAPAIPLPPGPPVKLWKLE